MAQTDPSPRSPHSKIQPWEILYGPFTNFQKFWIRLETYRDDQVRSLIWKLTFFLILYLIFVGIVNLSLSGELYPILDQAGGPRDSLLLVFLAIGLGVFACLANFFFQLIYFFLLQFLDKHTRQIRFGLLMAGTSLQVGFLLGTYPIVALALPTYSPVPPLAAAFLLLVTLHRALRSLTGRGLRWTRVMIALVPVSVATAIYYGLVWVVLISFASGIANSIVQMGNPI